MEERHQKQRFEDAVTDFGDGGRGYKQKNIATSKSRKSQGNVFSLTASKGNAALLITRF